jgi:hypothetical protein
MQVALLCQRHACLRASRSLLLAQQNSCRHACSRPPSAASGDTASAAAASSRPLLILGIESSCDDTGAAVVTSDGRVLGEALAMQAELHAPWGGVVPSLAQQAHRDAIDRVVDSALQQAGVSAAALDAVAVTVGPGLSLCLDVGVRKAREVSRAHGLPLVPVHHMEVGGSVCAAVAMGQVEALRLSSFGFSSSSCSWAVRSHTLQPRVCSPQAHALVARMSAAAAGQQQQLAYPFLCCLVSGGHNLLVLVKAVGQYTQLGTTLDDALGERLPGWFVKTSPVDRGQQQGVRHAVGSITHTHSTFPTRTHQVRRTTRWHACWAWS